jgi:hypothetical protein
MLLSQASYVASKTTENSDRVEKNPRATHMNTAKSLD